MLTKERTLVSHRGVRKMREAGISALTIKTEVKGIRVKATSKKLFVEEKVAA